MSGVRPNAITVAVVVEALGRCSPPRITEASFLIDKLERDRVIPSGNAKVITALIRACGMAGDMKTALEAFRRLRKPDLVAVNALLDLCCKCRRESMATQVFDFHFRKKSNRISPDVISYSILISAFLKATSTVPQAIKLYTEMKMLDRIHPDTALVDIILRTILRHARSGSLSRKEAHFVATVLRDAEQLSWEEGQLERRKRAVRGVLSDLLRDVWKQDDELSSLLSVEDDLFRRKGWNKVDSGFSLWGKGREAASPIKPIPKENTVDKFLSKHGWNDVDSGFRIL